MNTRMSYQEQQDHITAAAEWERQEFYTGCLNRACAAIRNTPANLVDAAFIGQVLSTLAAAAFAASLNEIGDELDVVACEITP